MVRGTRNYQFSLVQDYPHKELAAQIARQASVKNKDEKFAVVFAAMRITFKKLNSLLNNFFKETEAIDGSVLFINLADDPAMKHIATPRMALTAAEYLAFEKDMHVLVIMTDIVTMLKQPRNFSCSS